MTCIVALKEDGVVYMGCDSQVSCGWVKGSCETKILRKGEMVIGTCGLLRGIDALRVGFTLPKLGEKQNVVDWMYADVVPAMKHAFENRWFKIDEKSDLGCYLLVGYRGHLFQVSSDLSLLSINDYWATGSGGEVALGSLYSTDGLKLKPQKRLTLALEAAEKFATGVRGPFTITHT